MGASLNEPSVDEFRRESEQSRVKLTQTVQSLSGLVTNTVTDVKERLSPTHIKQDVKDYVRNSGEHLVETLQRKASENPLQAVAIGAGLAIPLWRLVKNIPTPILLVGAGLLLSNKQVRVKSAEMAGEAKNLASRIADQAADVAANLQSTATQAADSATGAVAELKDTISASAVSAKNAILGTAHDAKNTVSHVSGEVADAIQAKSAAVMDAASQAYATAKETAENVSHSRDMLTDFVKQNPLLVGGIGLTIGALIASSLPRSKTENRLLGQASQDVKNQAREALSAGVDGAKDVAVGIATEVAASAVREGLGSDGVKAAVSNVVEGVKKVATTGLNVATGAAASEFRKPTSVQ